MSGGPILTPDAGRDAGDDAGREDDGGSIDAVAPTVVGTSPASDAVDVAVDAVVTVTFSEEMAAGGTITLEVNGVAVAAPASTLSEDGTAISFTGAFESNDRVRIVVERDFTDLAGNPLAAPHVFSFTVEDATPPFVVVAFPGEAATDVSARTAQIQIMFSEPLDADVGSLSLEGGPGELGEITWTLGGLIVPVTGLAYDTSYRVVLTGFADAAGNALETATYLDDGALDFTTGPDVDAPRVTDASPSEGQIEVTDTRDTLTVIFDEPMDTSITSATLTSGAASVTVTGTWSLGGTRIDFDVDGQLARNAPHALALDGFADAAGNALDPEPHLGDGALDFVTGVDIFAPYVGFTDPVEGSATMSFRQDEIVVVFSEAMDTIFTSVEISDGTSTITAPGTWSLAGTRFTIDVSGELYATRSYTIDFRAFTDAGGTALDIAHPYLGDGVLEFTLADPTGENCQDVLRMQDGTPIAGGLSYTLAPGAFTVNDGSNTCQGSNAPGIDGVILYRKTTPSIAGGGAALRIHVTEMSTFGTSMAVAVLASECDPTVVALGPQRLRCVGDESPQTVYLDVGPGDYYVWVSRDSTGEFPGATVTIEEVALPPEGETCANPFDTSTASTIYTPPATAIDPHVWTIAPGTMVSLDHAVSYDGAGAMVCDTGTGGAPDRSVGPDAVVALPKATSTSIGWVQVETVTATQMVAEIRAGCAPPSPYTALGCEEGLFSSGSPLTPEIFETVFDGAAGDYYVWLAGDSNTATVPFPGALVRYREIEPGPGDSCATAIPLAPGANPVTVDRPYRLPAPSCFGGTETVTWYRFTTTERFTHVRANAAANIAAIRASDASELACQASASGNTPVSTFIPPGTDVCIAVASGPGVTTLTLESFPYAGNMGVPTQLDIVAPRDLANDNWMTVTPTTLYLAINGAGVVIAPRGGGAMGDLRTDLTTQLGQGGLSIGEAVWSLDDLSTSNATPRLYRLVDSLGSWAPVPWEGGMTWPADGFDAITYDGTNLLVVNDYASTTLPVQLRTFSPTGPGPGSAPVTIHASLRNVVAIAADSTWLYMVGGVMGTAIVPGIYRIRRTELGTGAPELIASIPVSTTRGAIFVDSLTTPTYLYVRASTGDVHVIANPGGTSPVHLGAISTLGTSSDFAMAYDRATNSVFIIESETVNSEERFVRLD